MVVSIENLLVEYRAGTEPFVVLDILQWEVSDGEQVAISGPSGSGKSTLLNVIAGLLSPTKGSVVVCGKQLAGLGEAERDRFRAGHIAYIFQTFNLLQGYTAIENVLVGATFSREKPDRGVAKRLLEEVGLAHRENHYPAELSIGEQQRVAIARALVKKPKLILADEPTGSLDPRHAGEVVKLLRKECEEHESALILVSHEASIASAFGRQVDFLRLNRALATAGGKR